MGLKLGIGARLRSQRAYWGDTSARTRPRRRPRTSVRVAARASVWVWQWARERAHVCVSVCNRRNFI